MFFSPGEIYRFLSLGGPVMIPLIVLSVWMWILIFEKYLLFKMLRKPVEKRIAPLASIPEQLALNRQGEQVLLRIIKIGDRLGGKDINQAEIIIKKEKLLLRKNLGTINTLAVIAPLLGLLGTVFGMVTTFDVISTFGTGNAKAMAEGISSALITTQSGLLIAVPGLFMGTYLSRVSLRLETELDDLAGFIRRAEG